MGDMNTYKEYYEEYSEDVPSHKELPLSNPKRVKDLTPFLKSPVLDVGCGKGYDVNYFKQQGFEIEGCDISEKSIEKARQTYPDCNFFPHNFEISKTEQKYNSIYAFDVIEHVFDYNAFLENISKSLNERGTLILSIPNVLGLRNRLNFLLGRGDFFDQMPHIRYFTPKTIERNLYERNFKMIKIFGYSTLPLPTGLCGCLTTISEVKK